MRKVDKLPDTGKPWRNGTDDGTM